MPKATKKEPTTPLFLLLPTQLKRDVDRLATKKGDQRKIVISALTMYLAYVASQPAPAPVATPEGA